MAITTVQRITATTAASSLTTTPSVALSGAAVGDLVLAVGVSERGTPAPTLSLPGTVTTLRSEFSGSAFGVHVAWCRLAAGQTGGNVTVTQTSNRRMSVAGLVLRGAGDPVAVNTSVLLSADMPASQTATGPVLRPTKAGSLLLLLAGMTNSITPYGRSYTVGGTGWTELDEISSTSTTANNATALTATLTGVAAGADAAAPTVSESQAKFSAMLTGVVVPPTDLTSVPSGWREVRAFRRT